MYGLKLGDFNNAIGTKRAKRVNKTGVLNMVADEKMDVLEFEFSVISNKCIQ